MRRAAVGGLGLWLGGLCFLPPIHAAQAPSTVRKLVSGEGETELDDNLKEVLASLREGFIRRETDLMKRFLGPKKVLLSGKSWPAEIGYYTGNQLHFIFQRKFRELETKAFQFSTRDVTVSDEDRAFVRAEWTYVAVGSDTPALERLQFAFEKERGQWFLSEIKTTPP
jgi:hypothetical protein